MLLAWILQGGWLLGGYAYPWGRMAALLLYGWAGLFLFLRDADGASPGKHAEGIRVEGRFRSARNFTLALWPLSSAGACLLSLVSHLILRLGGEGVMLAFCLGILGILLAQAFLLGILLFPLEAAMVLAGAPRLGDRLFGTSVRLESPRS